jgi:hypothetical protein
MSKDNPAKSHTLRDAIQDMQDDAARIISDAIERQVKQFLPRDEAKAEMLHNPLHAHMRKTFDRCLEISVVKNQDYASDSDPFRNFRRAEIAGVSVEQGILVRITDKLCRIVNLLEHDAAVETEKLGDTIDDSINYFAILLAWLDMEAQHE